MRLHREITLERITIDVRDDLRIEVDGAASVELARQMMQDHIEDRVTGEGFVAEAQISRLVDMRHPMISGAPSATFRGRMYARSPSLKRELEFHASHGRKYLVTIQEVPGDAR